MKCSYTESDVTLLLKDLTGQVTPVTLEERAKLVKQGVFERSVMIKEYPISEEYQQVVIASMDDYAAQTALAVANLGSQLYESKGCRLVLVSIVRAGIPIGILLKRWIKFRYGDDVAHYAISLVNGPDMNAMRYITNWYGKKDIVFVDGWTGKGSVCRELRGSADRLGFTPELATLSDAIGVSDWCGCWEDIAIPSAPLNATGTGLVSITVLNNAFVGEDDFHGAMYLKDLEPYDKSLDFLQRIESEFSALTHTCFTPDTCTNAEGAIRRIAESVHRDAKLLNPGVNEAARAILRRDLECLLVSDPDDFDVRCISKLANLKGVPVYQFDLSPYKAMTVARR